MSGQSRGLLTLIATPIGNLADLTHRAEAALRGADIIACEDTRHSARLLDHYGIRDIPRVSLHAHNEAKRSAELVAKLKEGAQVAVISDAGFPAISDPGQRLLQRCLAEDIAYDVLPGPSALLTALVGSGLPTDTFSYGGFLPNKSGQRARRLQEALDREETVLFFESPHRLTKSLAVLAEKAPDRLVCVARELTKKHQEYRRGPAVALAAHYDEKPPKGEITLLIAPSKLPPWFAPVDTPESPDEG